MQEERLFAGHPVNVITDRIMLAVLAEYPTLAHFLRSMDLDENKYSYIFYQCINTGRYLEICKRLKLDPFDCLPMDSFYENKKENILENRLMEMYCDLNLTGRTKVMDYIRDLCETGKYKRNY